MAVPALDEILAVVAFDYRGWSGAVVTAADAEGRQQAGEIAGIQRVAIVPFVPLAVIKVVKMMEQVGGRYPVLIGVTQEGIAKVEDQLQGGAWVFKGRGGEYVDQGAAGAQRPVSADEIGDVQQGLGAILLAGGEFGRELVFSIGSHILQAGVGFAGPLFEAFDERLGHFPGLVKPESPAGRAGLSWFQSDGNGDAGKTGWKDAIAGKSLRSEHIHGEDVHFRGLPVTDAVNPVVPGAHGEEALGFDVAAGGAQGDMAVIQQQRADKVLFFQLVAQDRRRHGSMEPGL